MAGMCVLKLSVCPRLLLVCVAVFKCPSLCCLAGVLSSRYAQRVEAASYLLLSTDLQELLPGIINQLGPDNLSHLQKLAQQVLSNDVSMSISLSVCTWLPTTDQCINLSLTAAGRGRQRRRRCGWLLTMV